MSRLVSLVLIAFFAALAAGMGASVVSAGRSAAAAAPAHGDSASADSSHADRLGEPPAVAYDGARDVSSIAPVSTSASAGAMVLGAADPTGPAPAMPVANSAGTSAAATPAGESAAPPTASRPRAPGDTALVPTERRLAKVFAAMPPRDAARVLEQMSDTDVELLLGYLSERQAAVILGSFPPQRAARIGQNTLRGSRVP